MEGVRELIRSYLCRRVGRLTLQWVILRYWDETGGSVHFAGRRVDQPSHPQFSRGLKHVQRPVDVCADICVRRVVRVWDRYERGKVEYIFAPTHRGFHAMRITHVTSEHFELPAHIGRALVQPAPRVEGIVEHERPHGMPLPHESFGDVGANESIGASY
jgi:hypothetical protein